MLLYVLYLTTPDCSGLDMSAVGIWKRIDEIFERLFFSARDPGEGDVSITKSLFEVREEMMYRFLDSIVGIQYERFGNDFRISDGEGVVLIACVHATGDFCTFTNGHEDDAGVSAKDFDEAKVIIKKFLGMPD